MTSAKSQRFGPYVILDRIGDGGMAEIFLAKMQGYSGFEKLLALKKIHPRYSQNHTFAQMLIHEAKLAAALQHFNVVQVHDLGEIDKQVYIAMEYVRGRDLAAVLSNTYRRKERLPLNLALCIGAEFITGLEYAHRMRSSDGSPLGIIHRDISPQNILISYEGEVKVTDFGIARVISEKGGFQLPGNLHGKFGYMSPEQVMNKEIDQRSDIFSAGVVLWEMLVGARLFRGKDHKETIKMIVDHEISPPSSINPEVPPSVDRICAKALARDRNLRYQTMGALLGELCRVADTLPRRAATRDLSVYMRRQFGTAAGGFTPGRATNRSERSSISQHSGFISQSAISHVANLSNTSSPRIPLGKILLQQGAINRGELEIVLAEQRARGGLIGELLVASGTISEVELAQALSTQSGLSLISEKDLLALPPPHQLLKRFPRETAETNLLLPVSVNSAERSVRLAITDPYDERAVLEAKVVLGVSDVLAYLATRSTLRAGIAKWYGESREATPQQIDIPIQEPIFALAPPPAPEPLKPLVLIADPQPETISELIERVKLEDCEVEIATDGKKARAICRERHPVVALLDASLPGIDGYNILLELRSANQDAAVYITSARGDDFRQTKALELGADDFIAKPFNLEVTTAKIRREISKRSGRRRVLTPSVNYSGVSGSLEDMTAIDIVQSLETGRKTAHVVLQYEDGRQGQLNVLDGDLVGSISGQHRGEKAFYDLAKPGPGLFRIEYRDSDVNRNLDRPNTYLMIEAMRILDEDSKVNSPTEAQEIVQSLSSPLAPPTIPATLDSPELQVLNPGHSGPAPAPQFSDLAGDLTLDAPAPAPAPTPAVPPRAPPAPTPAVPPRAPPVIPSTSGIQSIPVQFNGNSRPEPSYITPPPSPGNSQNYHPTQVPREHPHAIAAAQADPAASDTLEMWITKQLERPPEDASAPEKKKAIPRGASELARLDLRRVDENEG